MQAEQIKHVRESMNLKRRFKEQADEFLLKIKAKMAKRHSMQDDEDLVFVGVHDRRTDHIAYMRTEFKEEPLEEDYFQDAMETYR